MQIRIRADSVEIDGYVNAVERNSKPLWSRMGQFVERICAGAFAKARERNDNVEILLNHIEDRKLGSQREGNLDLTEDAIGLRVHTVIRDEEVVRDAKAGNLVGWSFGFYDRDGAVEGSVDPDTGLPLRKLHDLDLEEVSLLNRECVPAYDGTLVCVRSGDEVINTGEPLISEMEIREEIQPKQHENVDNDTPEQEIPAEEISNEETEVSKRETEVSTEEIKVDFSKAENILKEMKAAIVNAD